MNSKIEAFDKCFKNQGGYFDYNQLVHKEIFEKLLNGCRTRIEQIRITSKYKLPEAYFDFISNTHVNAAAAKTEDGYFIGINIGTWFVLSNLFFRMLSSRNILPDYGNISKEKEREKMFNAQITDTEVLYMATDSTIKHSPFDISRHCLAQMLTQFSIKFLVMHEYAHIIFGHLDCIGNKTKKNNWNEMSNGEKVDGIDSAFSQTLEMDADCYAIKMGILDIEEFYVNRKLLAPDIQPFFNSLESALNLWFFSIYSFFRIFGYQNCDVNKIKTASHPQTGIRQYFVFSTAHTIFQSGVYPDILEKIPHMALSTIQSVEKAFEEISEQPYDDRAIKIASEKESQEHTLFLMRNWNNVRPVLEKYSYGGLAPLHTN